MYNEFKTKPFQDLNILSHLQCYEIFLKTLDIEIFDKRTFLYHK